MSAIVKHGFDKEQIELIKSTLMAGKTPPTDSELALFGIICQKTGLDPFAKQIYAIQRYDNKTKAYKWAFQVSVDGLRAIAERTGQYAGSDEPLFDEGLDVYEFETSGRNVPKVCKVTVWKMVGGQRCPFVGVARYAEFCQTYDGKPSGMWANMPMTMLAKCAESQALRKAFPQCNHTQDSMQAVEVETLSVDDEEWRINAFEWGTSQGLDMNIARQIANNAANKNEASQQLKAALQKQTPVVQVKGA